MIKKIVATSVSVAVGISGMVLPFGFLDEEADATERKNHKKEVLQAKWKSQAKATMDKDKKLKTTPRKVTDKKTVQVAKVQVAKRNASSLNQEDIDWMARAIYSEARGEPYKGQVAVAAVIINRMESPQYPDRAKAVIMEKGAFTAVSDGQIWLKPDAEAYKAAKEAARGSDPAQGATYYFNPETATSKWIWSRPQLTKIGKHIFSK
ncbi:Cell wall hydrolase CwlJ, involved in spore germination [Marininema mesophilum]|uniref:Cell wall hydrolase CwlJ, involved in spore germination n=1 Tax=Marininema mesophilum TaxID=1048340 RepID=A0A1H3BLG5_9BACL|nr:cell wall hydrolase [Marininema mesophilum]SDX42625.1 Cell wall hydrolase CwlJ, involved in spore germination [Marininema mesophilum]